MDKHLTILLLNPMHVFQLFLITRII
ncbi:hypothetical protein Gogos_011478 [Gossypium gossypioides]|uniref:Uncharacterized protein n=1 Tax=Gossypium gossypioides TaxID=34282 RepID=A0A7J9BPF7_GOSGO|nr:hypothetical protein [Gossypium gossypioides]